MFSFPRGHELPALCPVTEKKEPKESYSVDEEGETNLTDAELLKQDVIKVGQSVPVRSRCLHGCSVLLPPAIFLVALWVLFKFMHLFGNLILDIKFKYKLEKNDLKCILDPFSNYMCLVHKCVSMYMVQTSIYATGHVFKDHGSC